MTRKLFLEKDFFQISYFILWGTILALDGIFYPFLIPVASIFVATDYFFIIREKKLRKYRALAISSVAIGGITYLSTRIICSSIDKFYKPSLELFQESTFCNSIQPQDFLKISVVYAVSLSISLYVTKHEEEILIPSRYRIIYYISLFFMLILPVLGEIINLLI